MVAGRLQEKNGFYYIVLSYTDSAGKRRQPWIGTGLPVKGNKKRAEKMLAETRKDFTIPKGQVSELSPDMAFSDYMRYWLKMMRTAVTETTYSSYCFNVEKHIIPYFETAGRNVGRVTAAPDSELLSARSGNAEKTPLSCDSMPICTRR